MVTARLVCVLCGVLAGWWMAGARGVARRGGVTWGRAPGRAAGVESFREPGARRVIVAVLFVRVVRVGGAAAAAFVGDGGGGWRGGRGAGIPGGAGGCAGGGVPAVRGAVGPGALPVR